MTSKRPRCILAIGGSDHDVNACVVRGAEVIVAIEEERISRKKYGIGGDLLQGLGRQYALRTAGVELEEIDDVVVDAILPKTATLAVRRRARPIDHHLCHASAAYFTSGFSSAAVIVVDNAGGLVEHEGQRALQATTWYHARGRDIHRLGQVVSTNWREGPYVAGAPYQMGDGDNSLGHFYKKVTGWLGFRFPRTAAADDFFFPEDGITMGLAAFAQPEFADRMLEHVEFLPQGQFRIRLNDGPFDALLAELLPTGAEDFGRRAAVAASAQKVLEMVLRHVAEHVLAVTGETRLCLGGGVAMNSVSNAVLLRETGVEQTYIPPVPGDNGTALGAALWTASRDADSPVPTYSVYSGAAYSEAAIESAVRLIDGERFAIVRLSEQSLLERTAELLHGGKVVAWFQGCSESGRRALGNRSILAAPQSHETRDHINSNVKQRQWFRPLAPVVTQEDACEYFEARQPSPYMQLVFTVRPEHRERLAAVTHVDGSARLQTVSEAQNPRLYRLLRVYQRRSAIPVLLNTSLNGRGEPIAETPAHAVDCLCRMPLDALVLDDRLVVRKHE